MPAAGFCVVTQCSSRETVCRRLAFASLLAAIWTGESRAQTGPKAEPAFAPQIGTAYFSDGADVTSAPAVPPQLGPYFSRGADVTSVPAPGRPGATYYSQGADMTSVPAPGEPGGAYYSRGADATSVPTPQWS